ncbi:MAG: TVP38/TMEM64 family protein [Proteobacteria bacterium]|nr:TVP38/TMEM64 family protein [Pseudomonadota bacterium]
MAPAAKEHKDCAPPETCRRAGIGRFVPLVVIVAVAVLVIAMGWHRQFSLENLVRHRAALDAFIAANGIAAIAAYAALYVVVVALSIPGAVFLTIAAGILFGAALGGAATVIGATIGATVIFVIARGALGEILIRWAGPGAGKLAQGFRADAFNYLMFLRLVPLFPFWLVNLVPAVCGVRLTTFVAATAIGIVPGTFAFAFFGAGLDSVLAAQAAAYNSCLATGSAACHLDFDLKTAATPQLIGALVVLGVVALIPVIVKRVKAARSAAR